MSLLRFVLGSSVVVSLALVACASVDDGAPSASGQSAVVSDQTPEERGAEVAQQNGCHGCHDSSAGVMAGNADGFAHRLGDAGMVTIYPANLTPDPKTGLGTAADGWSDDQITRAVRTGVDDECLTLCKVMPHFNLSDDDMTALIAYLRSLTPVVNDIANQGCAVDPSVSGGGQFVDAGNCPAPGDDDDDTGNADAGTP